MIIAQSTKRRLNRLCAFALRENYESPCQPCLAVRHMNHRINVIPPTLGAPPKRKRTANRGNYPATHGLRRQVLSSRDLYVATKPTPRTRFAFHGKGNSRN